MKDKIYIVDVSGYIFRAYFALPPMSSPQGEVTHALFGFIRSLLKLCKDFAPEHIVAVYDGPDNKRQRQEIYEEYKANRTKSYEDLPEQIEKSKTFCDLFGIARIEMEGVEADDAMGSIAKWAERHGKEVYLCTADKDFAQLVNENIFLLNTWKENMILDAKKVEEVYGVLPTQIADLLAIMGDASDNIPGISGFGPKTTVPLLQKYGTLENLLAHADEIPGKKGETLKSEKEVAILSKRLATIDTNLDFPLTETLFNRQEPKLRELRDFYLELGFSTLFKELEALYPQKSEVEPVALKIIDSPLELHAYFRELKGTKEICFDLQTEGKDAISSKLVGISFSTAPGQAAYIPMNGNLGKEAALSILKPFLEGENHFFGHNLKYDCHVLKNEGIEIKHVIFDTVLASYLLYSGERRHTLDHLALHYFGKVKMALKEVVGSGKKELLMSAVAIEKVAHFSAESCDYTFRLKKILQEELQKRELTSLLFDLELPLSFVLARMERKGIFVDVDFLKKMTQEVYLELQRIEKEIYGLAGEEFNINSPKILSKILFEKMGIKPLKKTATGFSTNAEVLEQLAQEAPIAAKILEYRTLEKLRSTYLESLPETVNPKTNRIHATFNQWIAATGRLACQDPNLQNIPVRTEIGRRVREAFIPEKKGWVFVACDYSQIELRLMAHLSGDEKLIEAFNKGDDIHTFTASLIFDIPQDMVSKEQRHAAKAINFGIMYGQGSWGLSQVLGIDPHEASQFIEAYFKRYPRVKTFIQELIEKGRATKKAVTLLGRERELQDIASSNSIARAASERLAINTPLQGTAADIIKLAMIKIDEAIHLKGLQSFMVLQIHDELIFEVPPHEVEILTALVKDKMEQVIALKVPLLVDVTIGKNWGEC